MPEALRLRILCGDQTVLEQFLTEPVQLGRQRHPLESPPFAFVPAADGRPARLVIASLDQKGTSRELLLLTPLPDGRVRATTPVGLDGNDIGARPVSRNEPTDLAPPFSLLLMSGCTLEVTLIEVDDPLGVQVLDKPTAGPATAADVTLSTGSVALLTQAQLITLLEDMPRALGVLQAAVGADDFRECASRALVEVVRLDSGRVLRRRGDAWEVEAKHGIGSEPWKPSRHFLERLLREKRTVWQKAQPGLTSESDSLAAFDTVVAAPLLDRHGIVVGALYGERLRPRTDAARSDRVAAMLVDVLASGVATGLARLEQEEAALKATARFEQFFTPELARLLAADPHLLEDRAADVTVLFADMRDFSRHCERLKEGVFRWLRDVMEELSRCVLDEGGVLVNYAGDGIMAMWGAPREQPDQAERALRAGLAMQACLTGLDEKWLALIGEKLRLGVGINSGPALVGNTGSSYKFQYGPQGHMVNVASRVQGLTKYLKCGVLLTAEARARLGEAFTARRVVRARVVNIMDPANLYQVEPVGEPARAAFFAASQATLEALERREFAAAAKIAGTLLLEHPGDGPLRLTLARAAAALINDGEAFDPVWTPPGK